MKKTVTLLYLLFFTFHSFGEKFENHQSSIILNCEPFGLPYLENFDIASPPSLPECWAKLTLGYQASVDVVTYPYNTSPHSVKLSYETLSLAYLILPEFESAANDLYVSFAARFIGGFNELDWGVMTNPADTSTFNLMGTIAIATGWNYYSFTIPDSEGLTGRITFRYAHKFYSYPYNGTLYLDDIFVNATEECPAPFRLSVEDLTDTSAKLQWQPFGPAVQWDIEWGLEGFQPGEGNLIEGITQTFLDLTDLQPETTYQFYVRSRCENDQTGSWSLPHTFKTYSDDECFYTFILHSTLGDGWNYPAMHVIQDGELLAELGQEFETGFTYTVQINLYNELNFEVYWVEGIYYPARVGLEILNPFGEQVFYQVPVGWVFEGTTIFSDIALCTPSDCSRPTNLLVTSISDDSAVFNWDENGEAAIWQIEYGLQGFSEGEGILIENVMEKPYQITGLQPSSTYEFMVRSLCSDSLISPWSYRKIFTTPCEPFFLPFTENFDNETPPHLPDCWSLLEMDAATWVRTNYFFYNTPPNSVEMRYHNLSMGMLILPSMQGDVASLSLKFNVLYMSGAQQLDIGVITNPDDESSFTLVESVVVPHNWLWNEYWIYFVDYTGEEGRIAIRYGNIQTSNQNVLFIDDVVVEALPTCPAPYDLYAADIEKESVTIGWSDLGNGVAWDVEWGVVPFQPGEGTLILGIDQNSLVLENLPASTRFQFYVRAHCAENETSEWSGRHIFATSCDVFNAPFIENFDDLEVHELPLCWTAAGSQEGQYTIKLSSNIYQSPPNSLVMNRQSHNYSMFISPEISQPIDELIIRFSVRFLNGEANILKIGTVADPNDTSSFTEFSSHELPQAWQHIEMEFDQYEGSDKHIAIKLGTVEEPGFGVIYIDDLEITLPAYSMTFYIQDENQQPVEGADIEIEGQGVLHTNSNGEASHELHNGEFLFIVSADGFEVYNGNFTIESDDLFLTINLISLSVDEEIIWDNLMLYPNPFDEFVYIENAAVFRKLLVFNLTGQVVFEKDLHGENIVRLDLSNLLQGLYLVEFYRENGTKMARKVLRK